MNFSERKGFVKPKNAIQIEGMTDALRNNLWNALDRAWITFGLYESINNSQCNAFTIYLWKRYFKLPIDDREYEPYDTIRHYYFKASWFKVYDFIEAVLNYTNYPLLQEEINDVLEEELVGYRFINGICTDITSKQEVEMLTETLNDFDYPGVREHLNQAFVHYSNKEKPDFRNSIKESISAVESLAQVITGKKRVALGDALKELQKKHNLHPALVRGFESIYGYTSDKGGIRHAMQDDPNLTAHDAKFFLLSCTSFINYLKTKI